MEGRSPIDCEVVLHVLACSCMVPAGPGLDVCSSELPCFDLLRTEDVSVNLFKCVPLVVGPFPVEGVRVLAMIEARNGFLDPSTSGVVSSLSSSAPIGLVGAVTGVRLVWPLSEQDWQDVAPPLGREGYRVPPKSGERVLAVVVGRARSSPRPWSGQCPSDKVGGRGVNVFVLDVDVVGGEDGVRDVSRILCGGAFSIPWIPGPHGVVRVVNGVTRRSIAPWVCCLCTPYVPRRGAWVLKPEVWGVTSVELPGIVVGRELLPTRVVFVGGGIPNRDHSPVKGVGGGGCASGCQIHAYCWASSLEAGDDIVGWKWGGAPVGSRDPSSPKESQSLQVSADLLSVYEREDEDGGEGHGNSNGYA